MDRLNAEVSEGAAWLYVASYYYTTAADTGGLIDDDELLALGALQGIFASDPGQAGLWLAATLSAN
jgi:hypothetical protein